MYNKNVQLKFSKLRYNCKSKDQCKSNKNNKHTDTKATQQSDNGIYFYITFVWKQ